MELINLLVSEEQEILRETYRLLLGPEPSINLVGVANSLEESLDMVPLLRPDVLVVGFSSPSPDMAEQLKPLREEFPSVGIVLLAASSKFDCLADFLTTNPRGKAYLMKQSINTIAEMIRVIHAVAEGRTVYDPGVIEYLTKANNADSPAMDSLTEREQEILDYIARGYKNRTIAEMLFLEVKTIEYHINNIFSKMGISRDCEQHARVHAALTFLRNTGRLKQDPWEELPGPRRGRVHEADAVAVPS